ncbi:MAG: calcium-binding protein, partial [Brevundimonas sp.]
MTPMVRMQAAALDRQAGETSPVASMPQPSDTLALISGGGEIAVDNDAPAAVLPPIIVRLAGGGFALIWADYSSATAPATTIIEARIYNAAGVAQGAAFTVNTSVHSGTPQISAVALTNGGFAVSWVDDSEGAEPSAVFRGDPATVRSQAFNASGTRVGAEQAVSSVDAAMQTTCRVIGLDNGGYAVVWTDWTADETRTNDVANGRSDIGIRFYGANGAPAGGAAHVNAAGFALRGVKDMVALSDGRFMLVWSATSEGGAAQSGLKGQLFSAGGAPVGNEIALSPASVGSDGQVRAVDGGFVVVWTVFGSSSTRHDVFTQAFTNEGVARGSATQANTTTPGSQQQIQVTTLADGNYVIIWTDRTNGGASADGSASGVQARVFRADGTPLSGQIQVNTATEGVQQSPRVVALAGGGFVIVWEDHSAGVGGAGGDTSQTAVKAQVYAEDGQPVGGEILVNVTTTGFQGSANVAALAGGGFVVSWVGSPDGGAYQHFARVFSVTADTINGTSGDDTLGGGAGAEIINGLAGNDTLNGGSGADIIDGGAGIDRLYGGTGNDTFYADVAADLIFEGVGEGTDTVIASAGFYLYANIENLTLAAGSGDFFGVGNDLA